MHSLLSLFEARVAQYAERLAVGDPFLCLNYASLRNLAASLAARLSQTTGQPHVGVLAPTSAAGAAAILACWYAGRACVPLNFLLTPAELAALARDAALDVALTSERFEPLCRETGLRPLLLEAVEPTPTVPEPPAAAGGDTAALIYTSGTSGTPKGVCLSFENLVRNALACVEHARLTPEQVFLSVLPQFHSFGFTAMTVTPLLLGATTWYLPRFSPQAVVQAIQEKHASVFMAVASMYAALLQLKDADPRALACLELAISGGEPLPAHVAGAFEERFGIRIMEGYGLTETSPVVSINMPWAHRPGSVGRPLPGVEVLAVAGDGTPLPAGTEGELAVRGHCVMKGYHNRPAETASVLRDGRLLTGDIGLVDEDGYVYITGRAKEMMIIAGENVFPREIESVLCEHPSVAEAAVIGAPDRLRGEVPVAFVVLRPGRRSAAALLPSAAGGIQSPARSAGVP
jgi:long-chain acyl-CoA synthetase